MNKRATKIIVTLIAILGGVLISTGMTTADTDGTEVQSENPATFELHLGTEWAGATFRLKTDAGLYPDLIVVGSDGILQMDLGGSASYILFLHSGVSATPDTATASVIEDNTLGTREKNDSTASTEEKTGIPLKHIALFCLGLLLSVGCLIAITIAKKRHATNDRKHSRYDDDFDYDDE